MRRALLVIAGILVVSGGCAGLPPAPGEPPAAHADARPGDTAPAPGPHLP